MLLKKIEILIIFILNSNQSIKKKIYSAENKASLFDVFAALDEDLDSSDVLDVIFFLIF